MKLYTAILQIKENQSNNKIKFKVKNLTEEAKENLLNNMLVEFIDNPRKRLLQELENVIIERKI